MKHFSISKFSILFFIAFLCSNAAYSQLNGNYTIKPSGTNYSGNPSGVSGKNYTSFKDAVSALKAYGVSGQVTFNIDSGSYKERVSIPAITGASSTKRIIFQSVKNDSTSVLIYWSSTHQDTNYTISLDDADYITLRKMNVKASGSTYGKAIQLTNGASYNIISNCWIQSVTGSSVDLAGIFSENSYDPFNLIENNNITGGFYGICFTSGGSETGTMIKNNIITDFFNYGISVQYQDGAIISGNTIVNSKSSGLANGIYSLYCNYIEISANKINLIPGSLSYGINLLNAGASSSNHGKIYNNFISITGSYTNTYYAISLTNSTYQDIAFNSICMTAPATFSFGVYMSGTTTNGAYLTNNIIAHYGGGFAIFTGNYQPLAYSNYNDLYSNGTYLCYYTSNLTSLSAWKSASGKDLNSVNVDPGFISYTDLHVNNASLNAAGITVSGITADIDDDTRSSTPDIGADEFTPIAYDAGVKLLSSPNPPCIGSNGVSVKIKNYGTSALNAVTLNWQINGTTQTPVSFSSLSLSQNQEQTLSLGSISFSSSSAYHLKFWTSSPNGNADGNASNDTLIVNNLMAGMKDTFTIGKSACNYSSLNLAVSDLVSKGACGPVVFRILAGTYNEQIEIPEISGASATNTITFESYDKDSSKAIVSYSAIGYHDNYVINFRGAKYIRIRHLGIKATGYQYGIAVVFSNGAEYNKVSNNNISTSSGSTSGDIVCIYNPNSSLENYNVIENNVISGGSCGVQFSGSSSSVLEKENIIRNNQIINFNVYGIQVLYERAIELSRNYIRNFVSAVNIYGVFANNLTDTSKMIMNNIHVSASTNNYGIYMINCYGFNAYAYISNNFILQTGNSSAINNGIYMTNCQWYALYNNTIKINASSASNGKALAVNTGTQFIFKNNIFSNFGGGYSVHLTPPASWVIASDYNDLYTTGSVLGFYNKTNYSNLAGWRTGTGQDAHSVSADPYFLSVSDLHVSSKMLDSAATPVSVIKYDIDNERRNPAKPDIGADEFTLLNWDLSVSKLISPVSPCSGSATSVSVKILNYGLTTVKNTTIKWLVNGVSQSPKSLICNLIAAKDTTVTLGSYTFNSGTNYSIKIWVDSLNGHADENHLNDTLIVSNILTGMNGNYTIGASGRDYKNFAAAIKDLKIKGICGPVVFAVDTGVYNEQISINQVSGASSINTITFRSTSNDSTKTIIQYAASSTADNYVIQLDGADYIRFEKFYLKGNTTGLYAQTVCLKSGANYNIFSNNKMETNSSMSAGNANVYNDQSSIDNYNVFKYNHFKYGAYLISCSGTSPTACETGNAFLYNICDSFGYYGMICQNQDSLQVVGNILRSSMAPFGIYIYYAYNLSRITNNQVQIAAVTYQTIGISLNYLTGTSSNICLVANNIVSITGSNSFQIHGIYSNYCYYNKLYHNSINVSATTSNTVCASMFFTSANKGSYGQIDLKNNIIVNTGGGYAIYVDASAAALAYLQSSDYNNIFSNGLNLGFYNKTIAQTLTQWKTASGKDNNSLSVMPTFVDFVDLHLKSYSGLRVNNPMTIINKDVDFENRSPSKPVIGADENPCFPLDAGMISTISPKTTACEGLSDFTIRLCNFGTTKIDSVDIQWIVNGDSNKTVRYKATISHLQEFNVYLGTDSLKSGQQNTFIARILSVNGKTDQYAGNDDIAINHFKILPSPVINKIFHDTICKNTDALLKLRGNTNKYLWYTTPTGGSPFSEDSIYQVSKVTATKPFYVEAATAGVPDSLITQRLVTFSQNMGNMFNVRALTADVIIDSFAIHPNVTKESLISVALWYKLGTFRGFETDSNAWNLVGYDTAISKGPLEFTTVSLGNIKIKKGDSVSFYISTTYDADLLYSTDGAKVYSNTHLRIATGAMTFYKFDSLYQSKKSFNGMVYYSTGALCRSSRDTVYAVVLATPRANLGNDTSFCRGNSVILNAGKGPGFKYAWKYGGNTDTISRYYQIQTDSSGIYSVNMSDTCGFSASDQIDIQINEYPVAAFSIDNSVQCFNNNFFEFIDQSTIVKGKIGSFLWYFDDGSKAVFPNPSHQYSSSDSFNVKLIAISDQGCKDSITHQLIVLPSPDAAFSVNQDTQCLNENLFLCNNQSTIGSGKMTSLWNTGDGNSFSSTDINHHYLGTGSFQIKLISISDQLCKDSFVMKVIVKASPNVNLGNDTSLKTNQAITLKAGSGFDNYTWSGGEQTDTVIVKTTYAGTKTIWVIVIKDGCPGYDTVKIKFDTFIGINQIISKNGILIYPNPTSDHLNIVFKENVQFPAYLTIENMEGQVLVNQILNSMSNTINLDYLPKGLYLLKIRNEERVMVVKMMKE